ncbi:MAG: plasmid pRiA4b ORF-3 family protein [Chloroflexi bacterium]|nr:plasmid pRiA4b ORF-3 family protein [Chloroflexota bacterium]MBU1748173.1 plasmid pRiA4b ORF-3 family protein [Chloroflexota bacterium]
MKTYTFHVSLPGTGRVWRKIELEAEQTLEDLHFAIQNAYDWDSDHLYSFFMSGKAWDGSTEYCLPEGSTPWGEPIEDNEDEEDWPEPTPEEREQNLRMLFGDQMSLEEMEAEMKAFWEYVAAQEAERGPGNVQTTTLGELKLKPGQEFMYLFDYGDEWRFKVRVHATASRPDAPAGEYPRLVESVGESPEQYPSWDDEEW